jgi:hypothetical protein
VAPYQQDGLLLPKGNIALEIDRHDDDRHLDGAP